MNKYQSGDSVKFGIYHTSIGFEFVSGFVCSVNFLKKVLDVSPVAIHCFDLINEYTLYSKASFKAETCLISRHTNLSPNQYFKKRHSKRYSIGHFGEARGYFNFDELRIKETDVIILMPGNGRYHHDYRLNPKYKFVRRFYVVEEKYLVLSKREKDVLLEFEDYYNSGYYEKF